MAGLQRPSKLFGSPRRTQVLILIAWLRETYPSELTRLLGAKSAAITYIVDGLEREGVIASLRLGRTRRLVLDPRYFAARELEALLLKLAEADTSIRKLAERKRGRPRRKGKSLE